MHILRPTGTSFLSLKCSDFSREGCSAQVCKAGVSVWLAKVEGDSRFWCWKGCFICRAPVIFVLFFFCLSQVEDEWSFFLFTEALGMSKVECG